MACISLNSRRSIGDRFLVDCNLGSHANGVPPRQPQREYTIELESMRYTVPEQYLSASETSTLRKQNLNLVPESEGN
ncbi:hypothetical protein TRAPUB_6850 [Trametes pubescens]|uniref:Uncharacterized protein n=1 Tax=Trametes pubescens TaxID=154538 RepID=A0A1M2V501_TRAPU|nr:hypothetical protein TRAPUB_6850 [Trametes pubescens]